MPVFSQPPSGARQLARIHQAHTSDSKLNSNFVIGGITFNSRVVKYNNLPTEGSYVGEIVASIADAKLFYWDGTSWQDILGVTI